MAWTIGFCDEFANEFWEFDSCFQDELVKHLEVLRALGPQLSRPKVDTLKGSRHSNLKELRFSFRDGVWRVAFAFAPSRRAVVLIAGDKTGVNQQRFYQRLIACADERFDRYLAGGTQDEHDT